MEEIQSFKGSWPWPWPWIRPYGIPSCITHRPLPIYQISLKSKKLFVDGRTDVQTDGLFPPSNIIRSTFGSRPKNNILSPRQHGFWAGHSCETQLILAFDDQAKSLDLGTETLKLTLQFSTSPKPFIQFPINGYCTNWTTTYAEIWHICGITLSWFQPFNSTEIKELLWMDPTHLGHKLSLESLREVLGPLLSTSVIYGPNLVRYQIICRWLHCASSHSWSFWSANSAAGHWYSTSLKLQLANEFQCQKCYILTVSHKCQKDVRSYTLGNITLLPVESFTYLGVTYLRT